MAGSPGASPDNIPQSAVRPPSWKWLWWVAGGCLVTIVLGIVGVSFLAWSLVTHATACVPPDFPVYPSSVYGGGEISFTDHCRAGWLTAASSEKVFTDYQAYLGEGKGNWSITTEYASVHRIDFKHARGERISGQLWIVELPGLRDICVLFARRQAVTGYSSPPVQPQVVLLVTRRGVCEGGIPQPLV